VSGGPTQKKFFGRIKCLQDDARYAKKLKPSTEIGRRARWSAELVTQGNVITTRLSIKGAHVAGKRELLENVTVKTNRFAKSAAKKNANITLRCTKNVSSVAT